jgi:hypothetical protein
MRHFRHTDARQRIVILATPTTLICASGGGAIEAVFRGYETADYTSG